jgi:hypothetical protein
LAGLPVSEGNGLPTIRAIARPSPKAYTGEPHGERIKKIRRKKRAFCHISGRD